MRAVSTGDKVIRAKYQFVLYLLSVLACQLHLPLVSNLRVDAKVKPNECHEGLVIFVRYRIQQKTNTNENIDKKK